MLESILTAWGLKMAFYIAVLGLCGWKIHKLTEEIGELRQSIALKSQMLSQLNSQLEFQNAEARKWKNEARDAGDRARASVSEVVRLRGELDKRVAELSANRAPEDATGAIEWLAKLGQTEVKG